MLESYVNSRADIKILKRFCYDVFEMEVGKRGYKDVALHVKLLPLLTNGFLRVIPRKDKCRYELTVNILPLLINRDMPNPMLFFYAYVTVVHELQHVGIIEENSQRNYREFLAYWEEIRQFSSLRWTDTISALLMPHGYWRTQKQKYLVSTAELLCNLAGYNAGYDLFEEYLEENERHKINTTLESLEFLHRHLVIGYDRRHYPYNLFVRMVREAQGVFAKNRKDRQRLEPLKCLFFADGKIKSLEQLYLERTEENKGLIDSLLINMFICADTDYQKLFAVNPQIKGHLAKLANQYCEMTVDYLKNIKRGEVFLDREILQDNAAMLIKNTNRLNKLMLRYEIQHTGGSVIPLYNLGK